MRLRQRIERRQQHEKELSNRRMSNEERGQQEGNVKSSSMNIDDVDARAINIATELRANDSNTRDYLRRMLQQQIDEQKATSVDRKLMQDDGIKRGLQVQGSMTGSMKGTCGIVAQLQGPEMQGIHQPKGGSLTKGNAKGGWHTAKGGKGDGKGVGRHKGGDSITETINRLLATKPK